MLSWLKSSFFASRKFIYAVGTLFAAVIVTALPSFVTVDPQTEVLLKTLLPGIMAVGVALITGHTLTDVVGIWSMRPDFKNLDEAVQAILELATKDEDLLDTIKDFLENNEVKL